MLSIGQAAVTATAAPLCTLPPGAGMVRVTSDPASTGTAYIGVTPAAGELASGDGIPVAPGGSLWFELYGTFAGASLSAVCPDGTATVGYLVSSYNG